MSVQEDKLKAIADAIREKDGTTDKIPASDFPDRIRAISSTPDGLRTIQLDTSTPEGGTVTGGGMASDGMTVTVSAEVGRDYEFNGWTESGKRVSRDNIFTFAVDRDRHLTALFEPPTSLELSWTQSENSLNEYVDYIVFDGKKFCAFGGTSISVSSDAKTWETMEVRTPVTPDVAYYLNGKFILIGNGITYSEDLVNWSDRAVPISTISTHTKLAFGNGVFVMLGRSSGSYAYYSYDLDKWTSESIPTTAPCGGVAFGDGMFVALPSSSSTSTTNIFIYSSNGIDWTKAALPRSAYWRSVAYGNGIFVAVGLQFSGSSIGRAGLVVWSEDGITWNNAEIQGAEQGESWDNLTFGGGRFVALCKTKYAVSKDGKTWEIGSGLPNVYWGSAVYGDGKFVAISDGTVVHT